MVKNFTGFAPLGLVITMTLGIGLCEESGLIMSLLKGCLSDVPPALVPYLIAFVGTIGNIASDTANIIVPPLAALLYIGAGKHPVVGMICGYAGANAGFTANLMVAGTDSLLQGLTNDAIKGFLPDTTFQVDVTCNWFFMIASTFLCSIVIGFVCTKVVEPRFGKYEGTTDEKIEKLNAEESKGLRCAGITAIMYIIILVVGFFTGPLAGENGAFVGSPLLKGLIPILFVFFSICAIAFGFGSGKFKKSGDISKAMNKQMAAMGSYVSFCFFCGQFQGLFNWTKLGTLLAIGGADLLQSAGFTGIPLFICFILVVTCVNIFMSSGSAKWAIFAPIFVPMFMLLGYHPGFTQLLYRLGDSPTNAVTPMSPYIWMVLATAQTKYMKDYKDRYSYFQPSSDRCYPRSDLGDLLHHLVSHRSSDRTGCWFRSSGRNHVNYPILQNYITEYVYFARACEVPWRFLSHLCRSPATPEHRMSLCIKRRCLGTFGISRGRLRQPSSSRELGTQCLFI